IATASSPDQKSPHPAARFCSRVMAFALLGSLGQLLNRASRDSFDGLHGRDATSFLPSYGTSRHRTLTTSGTTSSQRSRSAPSGGTSGGSLCRRASRCAVPGGQPSRTSISSGKSKSVGIGSPWFLGRLPPRKLMASSAADRPFRTFPTFSDLPDLFRSFGS